MEIQIEVNPVPYTVSKWYIGNLRISSEEYGFTIFHECYKDHPDGSDHREHLSVAVCRELPEGIDVLSVRKTIAKKYKEAFLNKEL